MLVNIKTKFNIGDTAYDKWFTGKYYPVKITDILIHINNANKIEISYVLDGDWKRETKEDQLLNKEEVEKIN